jgi:cell volume regulation protein A
MIPIEHLLVGIAVLLLLGIVASKTSGALGVPALVLFLAVGMLAGSDGPGGIAFDDPHLARTVGIVALVYILFSGGLDTEWRRARPVLWSAISLATLGVLVTAGLLGAFAAAALGFSPLEGLLLGAIVSSTDAAAVFAVLRAKNVGLKGSLTPLLELESGSNDATAVFLTVGVIGLLTVPSASLVDLVPAFVLQMALGTALGYGMGRATGWLVNRLRLGYEGLYPVLTLALVLLTYGVTATLGGSGFLAVYVTGLVLGNSDFVHKRGVLHFHEGVAWLMQIVMFLVLGLLVFPSRLVPVIGAGLVAAAFLILVARPAAVFLTLAFARASVAEKTLISWVGLRGAVPIILATFPRVAGIPHADRFFHLVFFIVLTSVLLQGTSIPIVARWLGLESPTPAKPRWTLGGPSLKEELVELSVPPDAAVAGRQVVELGLPDGVLIVLIRRGGETLVPGGGTVLEGGDALLVLGSADAVARARATVAARSRA